MGFGPLRARYRHHFDDLDGPFGRHEVRVTLERFAEGFLRRGLEDGVAPEIILGWRAAGLRDAQTWAERSAHVDDRRGSLLAPGHPRFHSGFLLLGRGLHHLLERRW